jgi:hypothetical protein
MNRNLITSILAAALCAAGLLSSRAAELTEAATAYAAPDAASTVLGTAKAGSRLATTPAPSGWQAVELAGPHTVYVAEKDTLKNFDVRPGASYFAAPRADAPVIGLAGDKDPAQFADIAGRYNKFSLNRALIGYVRLPVSAVAPVVSMPAAPLAATEPVSTPAASPSAPAGGFASDATLLRQDIPASTPVGAGQGLGAGEPQLARIFFGTIASTRNPLRPRRPHDFQLNDDNGNRFAFLDISNLLLTEKLETFIGRNVTIQGTAEPAPNSRDLIIHVESLKLR